MFKLTLLVIVMLLFHMLTPALRAESTHGLVEKLQQRKEQRELSKKIKKLGDDLARDGEKILLLEKLSGDQGYELYLNHRYNRTELFSSISSAVRFITMMATPGLAVATVISMDNAPDGTLKAVTTTSKRMVKGMSTVFVALVVSMGFEIYFENRLGKTESQFYAETVKKMGPSARQELYDSLIESISLTTKEVKKLQEQSAHNPH